MKKFFTFFTLVFATVFMFSSCSRTRDAVSLDSIYNIVKSGRWESVSKGAGDNISVVVEKVPAGGFAKFLDKTIQIYDANEHPVGTPITYSFRDTKTIVLDGMEYKVSENFVSSISNITAKAGDVANSFYIFKRKK